MAFVKLGTKFDGPELATSDEPPKEHFPTLFIDDVELKELPDEGTALIKYKIVRDTKTTIKDDGETKKRRSIEMDVLAIGDYESPADAGDTLDQLRDAESED